MHVAGYASTVVISKPANQGPGSGPSDGSKPDAQVGSSMNACCGKLGTRICARPQACMKSHKENFPPTQNFPFG